MGLDISHDAWHGPYSAFHRWRRKIAEVSGLPPLDSMQGFTDNPSDGIKWDLKHPLTPLLSHSDCDGHINKSKLLPIANALKDLLPKLEEQDDGGYIGSYTDKTRQFIAGCELAISKNQRLEFS